MSQTSVKQGSFTIERQLEFSPAQVFAAWANPAAKARWFVGPAEWNKTPLTLDFRVGGEERVGGGPAEGPHHQYRARYEHIVQNEVIVYTYDMHLDDARMSVSLATVEFFPEGKGTRLVFTEHSAFVDGVDSIKGREEGTRGLLDQLAAELRRANAH